MTADKQLKAYIDRVLRLKEEQDALGDDIRDVYAEAKAEGYDKTVMGKLVAHLRKVLKQGDGAVAEAESIFDTYLQAYHRASGTAVATHAHEEDYDRDTGEVFDINPRLVKQIVDGMQTEAGRAALVTAVDILIDQEEVEEDRNDDMPVVANGDVHRDTGSAMARTEASAVTAGETAPDFTKTDAAISRPGLDRPETENRSDEEASVSNASGEMQDECAIHLPTNSRFDPNEDREEGHSPDDGLSVVGANIGGDHVSGSALRAGQSHPSNNGEVRDLPNTTRLLRPHCQRPDMCGSGTKDHCWNCKRAIREGEAA